MDRRSFLRAAALGIATAAAPGFGPASAQGRTGVIRSALLSFETADLDANPLRATRIGVDVGPWQYRRAALNDYALEARAGWAQMLQARARWFAGTSPDALPAPLARAWEAERSRTEAAASIAATSFGPTGAAGDIATAFSPFAASHLTGPLADVQHTLLDHHVIENLDDAEAYIARLSALAPALDHACEALRFDAARGVTLPPVVTQAMLADLQAIMATPLDSNPLAIALCHRAETHGLRGPWHWRATGILRQAILPACERLAMTANDSFTQTRMTSSAAVRELSQHIFRTILALHARQPMTAFDSWAGRGATATSRPEATDVGIVYPAPRYAEMTAHDRFSEVEFQQEAIANTWNGMTFQSLPTASPAWPMTANDSFARAGARHAFQQDQAHPGLHHAPGSRRAMTANDSHAEAARLGPSPVSALNPNPSPAPSPIGAGQPMTAFDSFSEPQRTAFPPSAPGLLATLAMVDVGLHEAGWSEAKARAVLSQDTTLSPGQQTAALARILVFPGEQAGRRRQAQHRRPYA